MVCVCVCVRISVFTSHHQRAIHSAKKKNRKIKATFEQTWVICRIVSKMRPKWKQRRRQEMHSWRSSSSNPSAHVRNTITFFWITLLLFAFLLNCSKSATAAPCVWVELRKSVVGSPVLRFSYFLFLSLSLALFGCCCRREEASKNWASDERPRYYFTSMH